MRTEDFNIDILLDYIEYNRLDTYAALAFKYGMTEEDLTEEERQELTDELGFCDNCGTPMRYSDLTFNDNLRADVCYDCDAENQFDEEEEE